MALELNLHQEYIKIDRFVIPFYKEYYGRSTEQMPKLIADCRVPMSVAGLMQRRLDVRNSDADVNSSYLDNYFNTGDAVAYRPDGRIKIVLDSQILREMTPETPRVGGALLLGEDVYNTLQGEEFKKGKLGKTGDSLTREQAKAHPVWKVLARDQTLLNNYVDYIFAEGKQRFGYDTAMGVYPSSAQGNTLDLRAWYVYLLGYGSGACGRYDLDYDYGRFLGIAPEALRTFARQSAKDNEQECELNAQGKGASNIRTYTMTDLQAFDSAVKGLETIVRPELLEPFSQLRKKL